MTEIPVEVSARHIHISSQDLEILFGEGYKLSPIKQLSQPGQFAAKETLSLKTENGLIENIRILGPEREKTQVEISATDAYRLKISPPVRLSGDLSGSAGATLIGAKGRIDLKEGVIIAKRHIHANPEKAGEHGLSDGQIVSVSVGDERALTFRNVTVRIRRDYDWQVHIDTDEGNAAGIRGGEKGSLVK